jgi:hypothetical protein
MNPLAEAQVVFPDRLGSDKDVVAGLFEIFPGDAEEAKSFRGEFKQAVGLDFRAGELDRTAVVEIGGTALLLATAFVAVALLRRMAVLALWWTLLFLAFSGAALAFVAAAFAAAFAGALLSLDVAVLAIALWGIPRLSVVGRAFALIRLAWRTGRGGDFTRFRRRGWLWKRSGAWRCGRG